MATIMHYGIKGMRWGTTRSRSPEASEPIFKKIIKIPEKFTLAPIRDVPLRDLINPKGPTKSLSPQHTEVLTKGKAAVTEIMVDIGRTPVKDIEISTLPSGFLRPTGNPRRPPNK